MTKIDTLKLASEYILLLTNMLKEADSHDYRRIKKEHETCASYSQQTSSGNSSSHSSPIYHQYQVSHSKSPASSNLQNCTYYRGFENYDSSGYLQNSRYHVDHAAVSRQAYNTHYKGYQNDYLLHTYSHNIYHY